jgi:succinoglycan biosynthesis protein ExoA
MTYPTITVIIPRKAKDSAEEAIQAIRNCDYPQHLLEIIEVIGASPSRQRNMAAYIANGEVVYFLDNDSLVTPTLFSRVVKSYADRSERLAGVGGPNITPATDGFLQKTFGYALASPFAHFKMCARYKPTGSMRYAGEKELILCNLSVRKETFLREHGFDGTMYPNEENEFINRLVEKGYQFIYDPDAYVYRSRRNRFLGFIRQLFHYGGGRADQILLEGLSRKSLLFFLPLGLLCYLGLLLILGVSGHFSWWTYLPLAFYGLPAILSALQFAAQERNPLLVLILPVWYLLMHLSYGTGLLRGLLKAWIPFTHDSEKSSSSVEIIIRKKLSEKPCEGLKSSQG